MSNNSKNRMLMLKIPNMYSCACENELQQQLWLDMEGR
jgi:hypothetical protein